MTNNEQQRLNVLKNRAKQLDWVGEDIKNIAKDLVKSDEDITIATHSQGEGKSTGMCLIILPNDFLLLPTHKQVAEKRELLEELGVSYNHFFSLQSAVEIDEDWDKINPDEQKEKFTDELMEARRQTGWETLIEISEEMERLPHGETEPIKNKFDEEPVVEYYKDQIDRMVEEDEVILGTKYFFPVLKNEDYLSQDDEDEVDLGDGFLDEGLEQEILGTELDLTNELHVFDNGLGCLTPEKFDENLTVLNHHYDEHVHKEFIDIWEMYEEFIKDFKAAYRDKEWYETSGNKDQGHRVKILSTEDMPRNTPKKGAGMMSYSFVEFWHERIIARQRFNNIKSALEIEISNQMKEDNDDMVKALVKIKKIFSFFHEWFLYSGNDRYNKIWIEQYVDREGNEKPPEAEIGRLSMEEAFDFQFKEDRDLIIGHAEASENWLRKAWDIQNILGKDFDDHVTFLGENSSEFGAQTYHVKPAKDKVTYTKKMAKSPKYSKLYHDINNLHANSDKDVGVVCYKDIKDQFSCPVLWWGNKTGNNTLKDVDVLFVIGSPRPPAKEYLRQRFFLTRELPDVPYDDLIDLDGRAQVGMDDALTDMVFTNIVDRDIRDGIGRMRDQTDADVVFRIGLDSEYVEFDEEIDLSRMRGEMGILYGLEEWEDVSMYHPNHVDYLSASSKDGVNYKDLTKRLPDGVTMEEARKEIQAWETEIEWNRLKKEIKYKRTDTPPSGITKDGNSLRWYKKQ